MNGNEWNPRHVDENGKEWVVDSDGNKHVPTTISPLPNSEFTTYDTSRGHCALCGSLYCNGGCFK